MSQSDWPQEGRRPEQSDRYGQRGPDDWGGAPPGPPSGMSGGMKACLIVICVVGFCCVLCCGVFGYLGYQMVPKMSKDAATINAYRDDIAKIDLPPGLEPRDGGKIDNFMLSMIFVTYENPEHARFMMGQFGSKLAGGQEMGASMRQRFEIQRDTEFRPMTNEKSETRNIKIKGHEYPFVFATGEEGVGTFPNPGVRRRDGQRAGADKKKPAEKQNAPEKNAPEKKEGDKAQKKPIHHRISGEFEGKGGMAVIVIDFDDTYKEADIVKMLEAIQ